MAPSLASVDSELRSILTEPGVAPARMQQRLQDWFDRQVTVAAMAHGPSWPKHREWVEAYLREEIRQSLLAVGWRPRT